ncbi:hypothetical protein ABW19_dt0206857 [Dactylella cylindrospora]|nr:hypothetical protein ABW19_dt0206857 [Dactylella cylindrospora]
MSSLVTNARGETRFIGSSSGFSIFSPKGIQWVNAKTGGKAFESMLTKFIEEPDHKFDHWKPDVWDPLFANPQHNPLPPKAEAATYVNDFFRSLNILFPLFHQQTFESLLEQQYSNDPPKGTGWYAAFNMVMAIGCRLRSANLNSFSHDDNARGWKYFQNAICVYPSLTIQNTDILSIQALLAMPLFLQGTSNPQPLYTIIASAVRVAFSIGLHRPAYAFGFAREEAEQRKRIFWIAYMIDKDISLRSGRPSSINDDDINVDLPEEDAFDGLGMIELTGGRGKVNLFRRNCTFAKLQSKVYMQLYSAKAAKQSDGELLNTIGNLDRELEEWRDSIPLEFRPEHEIAPIYMDKALPLVIMHFGYFNCLATIHRMSIAHSYWTNRLAQYAVSGLSTRPLNPRVFSSAALSVSAARSSIHLLKYVNQNDSNCVWLVFYYPVTALITLFANILQNPTDANAKTDLKLMGVVVDFLNKLDEQERSQCGFEKLIYIVGEFDRLARSAIEKAEKEALIRRKRKKQPSSSLGFTKLKNGNEDEKFSGNNNSLQVPNDDPMNWSLLSPVGGTQTVSRPSTAATTATATDLVMKSPTENHFDHSTPIKESSIDEFGFSYETPGTTGSQPSEENELSPLTKSFQESFSSPFVPQSLWNLNQTFEWDWANLGLPNSNFGTGFGFGDEQANSPNNNNSGGLNWDGMGFF